MFKVDKALVNSSALNIRFESLQNEFLATKMSSITSLAVLISAYPQLVAGWSIRLL